MLEPVDLQLIRNKLITLVFVNVFQPVKKRYLAEQTKGIFKNGDLDDVLNVLIKEKRIVSEGGHYRITNIGMKSVLPGKGRVLRDIWRMNYLAESIKKRGGSSFGR